MAGNATLRMGYTRIEPFPGGRLAFTALEHDAKTSDGRGRTKAQGWIIAEAGAGEGLNRLCPSPKRARKKRTAGIQCRGNGRRDYSKMRKRSYKNNKNHTYIYKNLYRYKIFRIFALRIFRKYVQRWSRLLFPVQKVRNR